jgi:hypothetical protein
LGAAFLLAEYANRVSISQAAVFPADTPARLGARVYVNQVSAFLIVGQIGTNALGHHHDESAIMHVQPLGAAD